MSLLVEAEDGLLVDVVRGRDHHRLEPVQLKLDSQRLASIQSQLNYHHVVMTGLLVLTSGGSTITAQYSFSFQKYWTNHSSVFTNTEPIIAQYSSKLNQS